MREWNLNAGNPHTLTLACDARLEKPDYTNDHIWQIRLSGGEPPALSAETTYGLRARLMRLFPRFIESGVIRNDPATFTGPPRLLCLAPNYVSLSFSPFDGIDVRSEYWVPRSQVIAGKITIANHQDTVRKVRLELVAQLLPLGEGHAMTPMQMQVTTVLEGQTENLAPVLFLNGGPEPGSVSFPSLAVDLHLEPGNQRPLTWALAALPDLNQSFELARRTTARPWDAEMIRIQLLDTSAQVEIETGSVDWDAALAFGQKVAYGLLMGPEPGLPHPSFVLSRQPDQGCSFRGDGTEYNHLWNGQTALDAYLLSGLILPGSLDWARGFLLNFLAVQNDDGSIDWKPGLAGQRSRRIAQPLLANLAWRIYQHDQDRTFLAQIYPGLLRFLQAWFLPEHDRDGDGFPEWDFAFQTGFDENPIFDKWHTGGQGADIDVFEDPALGALLARECHSLILIARQIGVSADEPWLQTCLGRIQAAVESCWDPEQFTYRYRDRDTHTSPTGKNLGEWMDSGVYPLNLTFVTPQRLLFRLVTQNDATRKPTIQVFGQTSSGYDVEVIPANRISWNQRTAAVTTRQTFQTIDKISIQGFTPGDRIALQTIDYTHENITLLLPLWAMIPSQERARQIVEKTLSNPARYASPFGCKTIPGFETNGDGSVSPVVHVSWNAFIADGLLEYGFREAAAELIGNLLTAAADTLRREGTFRSAYDAGGGKASGDVNPLSGLVPMRLYLEVLGVRLISPWKVIVTDTSPFPGPITVKYRGLTVIRSEDQTRVVFPDGQTTTITDPGTHIVTMA